VRALVLLPILTLAGCVTVVVRRAPKRAPRPQMVRLHGSAKDCDDETLPAEERYLCDWLHGRIK
jgi:hypothetical protein